ncbi:MAG TPA: PEP-CTERM sorting domain-containing protein [Gemmatimonadaceae bacterium]|jgi:hypothetical protein|nr:PEP-CTERM sorting domain-containing protein [Gemmatimonadaceae bacterium]
MSRTVRIVLSAMLAAGGLGVVAHAQAPTIQVVPGQTPIWQYVSLNYIALSAYGVPALPLSNNSLYFVDIPPFEFGGEDFSEIAIASNGYVSVGPFGSGSEPNQDLPDPTPPNGVLAPFWTALDLDAGGAVYAAPVDLGPILYYVVDWEDVPDANNLTNLNSFEVWLELASGTTNVEGITYGYGHVDAPADGMATIGAENIYGNVGDDYYYNGTGTLPADQAGLAVITSGSPNLPEPSTFVLMGTGLAAVGFAGRRRKVSKL